ncbi:MAG: Pycsar system effector family protein [Bacteroidota bacterium]|uniref:Pycsar effector protein domain-containing protein n=2 Tax=Salegentibacter flavus TaxID=287099 RepID=A0A1I5CV58_9FLAO|nr:Pycsar system effector family protein [Salegentibacter flavus]SFN90842.1 hypothetical protein SAMN05660413_03021 [Salegentibacter flavus]
MDTKLDKRTEKLEKYDSRGVQTLFRTLSRNHYNLLKMVDNKARIVLTVNSIITSLLIGIQVLNVESAGVKENYGIRILVIGGLLSMVMALLSMLPHRYLGKSFRKSNYQGTLYAANFSKQSLEEFRKEFDRIMIDGQSLYNEMISDLYFLGKIIAKKQRLLMFSVMIFLIGLTAAIIYFLMNEFI